MNRVEKWMIQWIFSEWVLYLVISTGSMLVAGRGMTKEACLYLLLLAFVSALAGIGSFFAFKRVFGELLKDCLKEELK